MSSSSDFPSTPEIYWRVETGPVFDWMVDFRRRRRTALDTIQEWAVALGAYNFGSQGSTVSCLFSKVDLGPDWRKLRKRGPNGEALWAPRRNTSGGKVHWTYIETQMPKIPQSDEFCKAFDFPASIFSRKGDRTRYDAARSYSFNTLRLCWVEDIFWLVLPDLEARFAAIEKDGWQVETPMWEPPVGMIAQTKAHHDLCRAQQMWHWQNKAAA